MDYKVLERMFLNELNEIVVSDGWERRGGEWKNLVLSVYNNINVPL